MAPDDPDDLPGLPGVGAEANGGFGTIRAVLVSGEFAFVLTDMNSDYREIQLDILARDRDGWRSVTYVDDVGFPPTGEPWTIGWSDGFGFSWIFGRDEPGTEVLIAYRNEEITILAGADGWWGFARSEDDDIGYGAERIAGPG